MFRQRNYALALIGCFTLSAAQSYAFNVNGDRWPEPKTTFHVDIPGSGGRWNDAFEAAMDSWNSATGFTFSIVRGSFVDPCQNPNQVTPRNGVKFSGTICGDAFGSSTLAIAQRWFIDGSIILQAGIVFNSSQSWDVYSGPLRSGVNDFGRVAVHELGHSLGLEHENSAPSIMKSSVSIIDAPAQDDINAVASLYDEDSDGIGIGDNCPEIPNANQLDTDADGAGDVCDSDDDNDGVVDNSDAFPLDRNESLDTDNDGIGNNTDADDDNDGVVDNSDAFPLDRNESVDTDNDGIGNNADADDDNDGVPDSQDDFPLDRSESVDTDNDGIGNNADADDDNDGVPDSQDDFPLDQNESVDPDSDGDGVKNTQDAFPLNRSESVDTDGDGVGDNFEARFGLDANDPNDAALDNDDDGVSNLEEFRRHRNPTVSESAIMPAIIEPVL